MKCFLVQFFVTLSQLSVTRSCGNMNSCAVSFQCHLVFSDIRFLQPVHVGDHWLEQFSVKLVCEIHRLVNIWIPVCVPEIIELQVILLFWCSSPQGFLSLVLVTKIILALILVTASISPFGPYFLSISAQFGSSISFLDVSSCRLL